MTNVQQTDGDVLIRGALRVTGTPSVPASSFGNTEFDGSDPLAATKAEHQHAVTYYQPDGTDVAVAIVPIYTVRGTAATLVAVEAVCVDAPSGGDKAFTVDLQKCNQGSPTPATVLTGAISYSSTQVDCEVEAGSISSPSLADGDTLVVVVAVSGSTGTQGQGLIVTVTVREDAD